MAVSTVAALSVFVGCKSAPSLIATPTPSPPPGVAKKPSYGVTRKAYDLVAADMSKEQCDEIVGDYDGDGKFDLAMYSPGNRTWYIQNSFNGSLSCRTRGVSGDRPVPADYNGDFRNDAAVWRPSNGTWYIAALPNIGVQAIPFGTNGDTPVAAAYLP